jgi:hypothetical protein
MIATAAPTLDARLYRAALRLCPGEFREEHGAEMAADFDAARAEATDAGRGALWSLRLFLGLDLVRTIAVQWLRTGLPVIACIAVAGSFALMAGLASAVRAVSERLQSTDVETSEGVAMVLLSAVAVMVIVATIVFTSSLTRPRRAARR